VADIGSQPSQTSEHRQHTENARQEGGPDNEVARQECIESEKYQGHASAPVIHLKKQERQRLQLFGAECTQVVSTSQDEQGDDKKDAAKSLDDTACEAQERSQQRDAPARRLEQVIEESRHSDIARHFDEEDCVTPLKQASVRQDVGRRSRGVAIDYKPVAHETLSEYSRQYGEERESARDSGFETRRCFCGGFRHYNGAHNRFSEPDWLDSTLTLQTLCREARGSPA
jgi:hypothetical protein